MSWRNVSMLGVNLHVTGSHLVLFAKFVKAKVTVQLDAVLHFN